MAEPVQIQQGGWYEWPLRDFTQGYVDTIEDHLLPDNASPDCVNVIAREIGSLKKRAGQVRLNSLALGGPVQGLYAYYRESPDLRRVVAVAGGVAHYWDEGSNSFIQLKGGLDNTALVCFATCVNYMVSANGVNAPWKWDGTAVSNLANAPTDGQLPLLYKEKLFMVPKSEPSTVVWSESFQPEQWPAGYYWDIAKGDGDVITCLREHLGQLVIFKRRSLHTLTGTSLDDFRYELCDSVYGCAGPFAAVSVGPRLYFVSDQGFSVWNGMQVTCLSDGKIPSLWDRVNKEHLHKAAVCYWDGLIWIALPEKPSSYNNLVIVYDPSVEGGRFWVWRGIQASCFQPFDTGTGLVLYAGDAYGGYVNQLDTGTDDFGNPILAYWTTKTFDIGSPERRKKFRRVFVADSPGAANASLEASLDYGAYRGLSLEAGTALVRRYAFGPGSYGRYLSLRLTHDALGGFEVRGLTVEYKLRREPR